MSEIRCKSGMTGWQSRLAYQFHSLQHFKNYDETYGLAARLGFNSAEEAWDRNPIVQGSAVPEDYCRVYEPSDMPIHVKVVVELQVDTDNKLAPAWKIQEGTEQAVKNMLEMGQTNGFPHEHADLLSIGLVSVDAEIP